MSFELIAGSCQLMVVGLAVLAQYKIVLLEDKLVSDLSWKTALNTKELFFCLP